MSDKEFDLLISSVVLIFVFIIILCPVIALWVYIILQNGRRKRIRERIIASRADLIGNKRWFPVRYASPQRFDSLFKILPWDTAGIFIVAPGSILFLGETLAGAPISLQFAQGNSRIAWLGKCPWPNGAVSWFQFQTVNQKHYFTSETGIMIFGSHKSTKAVYDEASQSLGSSLNMAGP